ncbi:MAG TPA: MarR family transcriptional regulator [Dialister sp.]|nr:MarR family transcriptional regulator [Dialister sp.]
MIEKTCGPVLKQLTDVLTKQVNNELREEGLTMSQMRVLVILDEKQNKTASMKDIEKELAVAQPTTAGIIRRIEEKGLIIYLSAPENKRAKWIQLTEAGKEKCRIAYSHMEATEKKLLSGMTEEEGKQFLELLKKALVAIRK